MKRRYDIDGVNERGTVLSVSLYSESREEARREYTLRYGKLGFAPKGEEPAPPPPNPAPPFRKRTRSAAFRKRTRPSPSEAPPVVPFEERWRAANAKEREKLAVGAWEDGTLLSAAIRAAEAGKPLAKIPSGFHVSREFPLDASGKEIRAEKLPLPKLKALPIEEALAPLASSDLTRIAINGVYLDTANGMAVATNGRGLLAVPLLVAKGASRIVAARKLEYKNAAQEPVKVAKGGTIDADFPNYPQVIPPRGRAEAVPLDVDAARRAARVLAAINSPFANLSDYAKPNAALLVKGAKLKPCQFLAGLEAMLRSGAKEVEMEAVDDASPVTLHGDNGATYVQMPVRVGREELSLEIPTKNPTKE